MHLKTSKGKKVTYSLTFVSVFFVRAKKRKEKIEKRKVPTMQCKCTRLTKYANVSAYTPTYTELVSPPMYV